jgi:fused signal recognition particle receptor
MSGLGRVLNRPGPVDPESLEELETGLLLADVGVESTRRIVDAVTEKAPVTGESPSEIMRTEMIGILSACAAPLEIPPRREGPFVILVVGVNGAGKTTTIAKLARRFQAEGRSVMLAAADTFRAAAVEQLETWGTRLEVPVVAQETGADPASVVYDAYSSARARGVDVLLADTAGRLHTQDNLMAELIKVSRVVAKQDAAAPHETMLVLDASMGQNAITQARTFDAAINLDSIVLTKLDGTAKGGVIFALAESLGLPIRFIGIGEGYEDLETFVAEDFVDALLDKPDHRRLEAV